MYLQDEQGNPISNTNPLQTAVVGNTLEEQLTESEAVGGVLTFSDNIITIGIYNTDETNAGVFNVNGIDVHVPKGEYVEYTIDGTPSPSVTVTGSTTYIVSRLI